MATAKDIVLRPISAAQANELVKRLHYSGKVVQNSQIHIGVFLSGNLEGAMQFGPSLDKRKIQGLVADTAWHEFIELNRMAVRSASTGANPVQPSAVEAIQDALGTNPEWAVQIRPDRSEV